MSENMENMEVQQPVEEIIAEPVEAEVVEAPKSNAHKILGIIGFVAGILALVLCCSAWFQIIFGIAAIVLSAISMKKAKGAGETSVFGIIGLILGILGVISGGSALIVSLISSTFNLLSYLMSYITLIMAELSYGY